MNQFDEEEVEKIRELLKVADIVQKEAEYKMAVQLVLKTWKNIVIALAATIAAGMLLREHIAAFWKTFIGG